MVSLSLQSFNQGSTLGSQQKWRLEVTLPLERCGDATRSRNDRKKDVET